MHCLSKSRSRTAFAEPKSATARQVSTRSALCAASSLRHMHHLLNSAKPCEASFGTPAGGQECATIFGQAGLPLQVTSSAVARGFLLRFGDVKRVGYELRRSNANCL